MASPTPGSSTRLNILTGYASSVCVTETDKTKYATKVYPEGIILHDKAGNLYHSDGVKTLAELLQHPIVDKSIPVLTAAERQMIADHDQAGGFVTTDANNKILDDRLNVVSGGKIVESYLSNYIEDGMIKLDVIPQEVRAHIKYVATYADLHTLDAESKKGMIFVIDATGDPTVTSGWAMYAWHDADETSGQAAGWTKVQEGEGIDFDYQALTTHDTVEAVGAVMYDHPVFLKSPTLDQLASLGDPVVSPVFVKFNANLKGGAADNVPLEAVITEKYVSAAETHKVVFTVTSGTVTISGFDEGVCDTDNPRTLELSAAAMNVKLAALKVIPGADGGAFTMDLDDGYDVKTITVSTVTWSDPTIVGASEPIEVADGAQVAFPVTLGSTNVSPYATYSVTVTPTVCSMLDDTGAAVAAGGTWTIAAGTIEEVNAKLAAGKIVGAATAGSVAIAIADTSVTATLVVNTLS